MKSLTTVLLIVFVLSILAVPVVSGTTPATPPQTLEEATLRGIFDSVKGHLGGVPFAPSLPLPGFTFIPITVDLDLYEEPRHPVKLQHPGRPQGRGRPQPRLSYSGEFKLTPAAIGVDLEVQLNLLKTQLQDRFQTHIAGLAGLESYEIERDDDSFELSYEQILPMVTLVVPVTQADGTTTTTTRVYIPYISVDVELETEKAGKDDDDDDYDDNKKQGSPGVTAGAGHTILEYDIDIYLKQNVVSLKLGDRNARARGKAKGQDVAPFTENGRTLVELRFLGEQLGADFQWDDDDKEVTIIRDAVTIKIRLGDDDAVIQIKGEPSRTVKLEVPARTVRGRIVVPVRFVSENFDADVRWNARNRTIIVLQ